MSKHTPAPWFSGADETGHIVFYDDSQLNRHIAYLSNGGFPDATQAANARLIAAAPDLLKALQIARATLLGIGDVHKLKSIEMALSHITPAISKATGEA